MVQFLNRLSGVIVGGVLYPLKSLLINVLIAAAGVVFAPFGWASVPFWAFAGMYDDTHGDILETLIFGILASVAGLFLFPFFAVAAVITHAAVAIYDVFRNIWNGVEEGVEEGLFNHVLSEGLLGFWRFSTIAKQIGQAFGLVQDNVVFGDNQYVAPPQPQPQPQPEPPQHIFFEPRVLVSPRGDLNGSYTAPDGFSLLTADELSQAGAIVGLSVVLERYNSLLMELQSLDRAIAERKPGHPLDDTFISDKLSGMEIDNPSLIVKQYNEDERWKVVPLSTYIIDRAHLDRWLMSHNSHPLTRDPIIDEGWHVSPRKHADKPTRYRILEYRSIANAQELVEDANAIRKGINPAYMETLSAAEPGDRPVSVPISSNSAFTLFGQPERSGLDASERNALEQLFRVFRTQEQ
jgi:hypothetical protein